MTTRSTLGGALLLAGLAPGCQRAAPLTAEEESAWCDAHGYAPFSGQVGQADSARPELIARCEARRAAAQAKPKKASSEKGSNMHPISPEELTEMRKLAGPRDQGSTSGP